MKELVFATHNNHKLEEMRAILKNYNVIGLNDIGCHEEIIEDSDTLEGNAIIKANFVTDHYNLNCFADDTGLEVEALDGAPGVFSARYAGEGCSFQDNVKKLLKDGSTYKIKGFISPKTGKSFDAVLKIADGEVKFDFS